MKAMTNFDSSEKYDVREFARAVTSSMMSLIHDGMPISVFLTCFKSLYPEI